MPCFLWAGGDGGSPMDGGGRNPRQGTPLLLALAPSSSALMPPAQWICGPLRDQETPRSPHRRWARGSLASPPRYPSPRPAPTGHGDRQRDGVTAVLLTPRAPRTTRSRQEPAQPLTRPLSSPPLPDPPGTAWPWKTWDTSKRGGKPQADFYPWRSRPRSCLS